MVYLPGSDEEAGASLLLTFSRAISTLLPLKSYIISSKLFINIQYVKRNFNTDQFVSVFCSVEIQLSKLLFTFPLIHNLHCAVHMYRSMFLLFEN